MAFLLIFGGFILFKFRNKINKQPLVYSILGLSAFLFLFTGSTKNYHLFILYTGILYLMISCTEYVVKQRVMQFVMVFFIFYSAYNYLPVIVDDFKKNIESDSFSMPNEIDKVLVEQASVPNRNFYLIDNRSWIYLFSGKVPLIPINPSIIYKYTEDLAPVVTERFILAHKKMCSDTGALIAIHKTFVLGIESERLKEIYNQSTPMETQFEKGTNIASQEYDFRIIHSK